MLQSEFFKPYSFSDIQEARKWVDENYNVNDPIKGVWHPITRLFCELKNAQKAINPEVFLNIEFSSRVLNHTETWISSIIFVLWK